MSLFDVLGENRSCGWRHPRVTSWVCAGPFGHTGPCQHLSDDGWLLTWPGPGHPSKAAR